MKENILKYQRYNVLTFLSNFPSVIRHQKDNQSKLTSDTTLHCITLHPLERLCRVQDKVSGDLCPAESTKSDHLVPRDPLFWVPPDERPRGNDTVVPHVSYIRNGVGPFERTQNPHTKHYLRSKNREFSTVAHWLFKWSTLKIILTQDRMVWVCSTIDYVSIGRNISLRNEQEDWEQRVDEGIGRVCVSVCEYWYRGPGESHSLLLYLYYLLNT